MITVLTPLHPLLADKASDTCFRFRIHFFLFRLTKVNLLQKQGQRPLTHQGNWISSFFLSLFSNTCADWQSGRCLHIHECLPRNCSLLQLYGFQENYIVSNGLVKWFNCSSVWQLHSVFILWGNKCFLLAGFTQHI